MPTGKAKASHGSASSSGARARTRRRTRINTTYIVINGNVHCCDHSTNISNVDSNNVTETHLDHSQNVGTGPTQDHSTSNSNRNHESTASNESETEPNFHDSLMPDVGFEFSTGSFASQQPVADHLGARVPTDLWFDHSRSTDATTTHFRSEAENQENPVVNRSVIPAGEKPDLGK
ncbi:hypothetical protein GALMADRAFT_766191 [Galerina marginata CBS 339.88]|uniref:Uncharacterized protein n=1 Tax=Galerina marginata (strain CBS 339.88) TaxID=685588 RepID=A0A067SWY8_GALM3|nr:hypothetical protein GALMADRAFT_766191 [Galerina marginata CBS 339.88]